MNVKQTLTLINGGDDSLRINKQSRWLRDSFRQIVQEEPTENSFREPTLRITFSPPFRITNLLNVFCFSFFYVRRSLPSCAFILTFYIPFLQCAVLVCWLRLPLTDYCALAILRRFLALRSLYLKYLNRFRVQMILVCY